jgi:hypothetical protein
MSDDHLPREDQPNHARRRETRLPPRSRPDRLECHQGISSAPAPEAAELSSDFSSTEGSWRCKACDRGFAQYQRALQHAQRGHPERAAVDPRDAVEWVA